jgi:hypothetical protein
MCNRRGELRTFASRLLLLDTGPNITISKSHFRNDVLFAVRRKIRDVVVVLLVVGTVPRRSGSGY